MSETPIGTDGTPRLPMTLARLRALLDAYGARPERWPSDEREAAVAFLAESTQARALQAAAARMDALLDVVPTPRPSAGLVERALAGSPAARQLRPRSMVQRRMAVAALLAAAAAVLIWVLPRLEGTPTKPIQQYAVGYQGVYVTPTDVLLVPPGLDLSRTAPAVGCVDKGLGCSVSDLGDEQSRAHYSRRVDV